MSSTLPLEDIVVDTKRIRTSLWARRDALKEIVDRFEQSGKPEDLSNLDELISKKIVDLDDIWKITSALNNENELSSSISRLFLEQHAEKEILKRSLGQIREDYQPSHSSFIRNILALQKIKNELAKYGDNKKLRPEIQEYSRLFQDIFAKWKEKGADERIVELRNRISIKVLALNKVSPPNPFHSTSNERALKCELAYELINKLRTRFHEQAEAYTTSLESFENGLASIEQLLPDPTVARPTPRLPSSTEKEIGEESNISDNVMSSSDEPSVDEAIPLAQPIQIAEKEKAKLDEGQTQTESPQLIVHSVDRPMNRDRRKKGASGSKILVPLLLVLAMIAIYFASKSNWGQSLFPSAEDPPLHAAGHSVEKAGADDQVSSISDHLTLLSGISDSLETTRDSLSTGQSSPTNTIQDPEYGIDVSHYQGDIDWTAVSRNDASGEAIVFAIMKSSEGLSSDPKFDRNWSQSRPVIRSIGAYHYFSFKTDGVKQAEHYIKTVDLQKGDIRPIVDVESSCSTCLEDGDPSLEDLISNLNKYISTIESHYGSKVIIYTGDYFYRKYLEGHFPNQDFWLASYSKSKSAEEIASAHTNPPDKERAVMWQFSSSGKLEGIDGAVDLNYLPSQYTEDILID